MSQHFLINYFNTLYNDTATKGHTKNKDYTLNSGVGYGYNALWENPLK